MNPVSTWIGPLYYYRRFRSALGKMENFHINQEGLVHQCPLIESKRRNPACPA